ncbi:MAG: hypothetical protein NUV97_00625 [archaeon]|nr:hypothetical protein [archaeon]
MKRGRDEEESLGEIFRIKSWISRFLSSYIYCEDTGLLLILFC